VKYPYNVNALSLKEAMKALEKQEQKDKWLHTLLQERDRLAQELASMDMILKVFPSDANFLLVKVEDPGGLYAYLMQEGIIVRDRSTVPLCEGCLRITVGSPEENRLLLESLNSYPKP
jgi:histidinol-phosphate aminotransferase